VISRREPESGVLFGSRHGAKRSHHVRHHQKRAVFIIRKSLLDGHANSFPISSKMQCKSIRYLIECKRKSSHQKVPSPYYMIDQAPERYYSRHHEDIIFDTQVVPRFSARRSQWALSYRASCYPPDLHLHHPVLVLKAAKLDCDDC
jgi:hypothetical protein